MSRKLLLTIGSIMIVTAFLLAFSVVDVKGQGGEGEDQFEEVHIFTTASKTVGVGTYVAAQAYGAPAGSDPAEQPAVAMILPYGIYPNMLLENIEDFEQPETLLEGFTFEWSLVAPGDSITDLITGDVAIFMADVDGKYELTLKITDPDGNEGESTWNVFASTYIGVGGMTSEPPAYPQCGTCHADKGKAWYQTAHATMFSRSIDGMTSDHYGPNCVSCHTTGFNNRPEAVNGGFDDVVREAGWTFPEVLEPGNWAALIAENPEVAAMANIQCESCHGPGQLHVSGGVGGDRAISSGLEYGVCAQCHAEEPYHVFPQQWENSAHGDIDSRGFTYPIGENRTSCVRCHSGVGFIDYVNGVPEEELRTDYQPITCAVCHDPHNADNPNQLRVFDTVTLPNDVEVVEGGPSATCMTCHNVRRDGGAEGQVAAALAGDGLSTPHHGNNQAELLNMTGGYTWGETLPISTHGNILDNTCVSCHMAPTPGKDADGNPLPGHNEVGQHSFAMTNADGVENIAVCQTCHDGASSFEFESRHDYDGDGATETVQEEIAGLREVLWNGLLEAGLTPTDSRPGYEVPENAGEEIYGALWNYFFTEANGTAVHNFRYAVALLQLSYEKVAGAPVPNADILAIQ